MKELDDISQEIAQLQRCVKAPSPRNLALTQALSQLVTTSTTGLGGTQVGRQQVHAAEAKQGTFPRVPELT